MLKFLDFYVVRHAWSKPNPNTDIRCWSESSEWPRKQPQNLVRHLQTIMPKEKLSVHWLHHMLWDYNSSVIGTSLDFLYTANSSFLTQSSPEATYCTTNHNVDIWAETSRDWLIHATLCHNGGKDVQEVMHEQLNQSLVNKWFHICIWVMHSPKHFYTLSNQFVSTY